MLLLSEVSHLFTEGIACWVILGEIQGFLTQSPGNQQLLPPLMCSSLVSDTGECRNFPVLLRGMEEVEDRLRGEKCLSRGAKSRLFENNHRCYLCLSVLTKKSLFHSLWLSPMSFPRWPPTLASWAVWGFVRNTFKSSLWCNSLPISWLLKSIKEICTRSTGTDAAFTEYLKVFEISLFWREYYSYYFRILYPFLHIKLYLVFGWQ